MVSFDDGARRFNYRTAALIERGGAVLLHHAVGGFAWTLPGGRVELGEDSRTALCRELEEELGVAADIGALAGVVENFFTLDGVAAHQLTFIYRATLPEDFPFVLGAICHRCRDEGVDLEFEWIGLNASALAGRGLYPVVLREALPGFGTGLRHMIASD